MKILLFSLLLFSLCLSAEIDTRLFEGEHRDAYYQEIYTGIETAERNKLVTKEKAREEKLLLSRLQNEYKKIISIEKFDINQFKDAKLIKQDDFEAAVNALANLRSKVTMYHDSIDRLQSKISYTKNKIENITETEKPNLLAYQLQFAYYKMQQKNHENKEQLWQAHDIELITAIKNAVNRVACQKIEDLDTKINILHTRLQDLDKKKTIIEIEREKELLDSPKTADVLQGRLEKTMASYEAVLIDKIVLMTYKATCLLHQENNKEFFDQLAFIEEEIEGLSERQYTYFNKHRDVLKEIAIDVFGHTRLFLGMTQHEVLDLLSEIKRYTLSTMFVFNEQPISILSIFKMVLLIVISFAVGGFYKKWILKISQRWPDMSQMSIRLTSNIGYYIIVFIGVMIALSSIGIDMTSISLIAGALSIGIGFGLQTVVSNLIAGIILMFERTIRIGDTIEITDALKGRVTDMRIRSTTIKTFDNVDIVVPNASFIQNNVINWTLEDKSRRLHVPFGVAYGTEVKDVQKAVLDELSQSSLEYIKKDSDKIPEVWMVNMNSSSVDFELLVWIEWDNKLRPNALRSEFLILIYNALRKNNIQIPFPQLDVHVKEMVQR